MRLSEHRLRETLESIADGFVTIDSSWCFTYVNRAAAEVLERSSASLLGKNVLEMFPDARGGDLHAQLQHAAESRAVVEYEGAAFVADDRVFAHRIFPQPDGSLAIYFHDVTARRRAEIGLKEADRRKDEFLATLAHELRNPLAPIRNAASIISGSDSVEPAVKTAAEIMNRQILHVVRLLEDLLDVSRISRKRLELRRERIDIRAALSSAIETSRPTIDAAHHELSVSLPEKPVFVDADAVRLSQVFSNLLNNAAKYTEPGGHIFMGVASDASEVSVCVKDDGIGIDSGIQGDIFEMFSQARPALRHSAGGLGIGLWLAKAIVEMHGGRVTVESPGLGKGSQFVVHLPRTVESREAATIPPEEPVAVRESRRVLIVDDLRDGADTLAMVIAEAGHEVRTTYDGDSALALAERIRPHVILLDLGMPPPDGLEVCRRIRGFSWGRGIVLIALTGWGRPEDRQRAEDAGFDAYFVKPVDPPKVVAAITTLRVSAEKQFPAD